MGIRSGFGDASIDACCQASMKPNLTLATALREIQNRKEGQLFDVFNKKLFDGIEFPDRQVVANSCISSCFAFYSKSIQRDMGEMMG